MTGKPSSENRFAVECATFHIIEFGPPLLFGGRRGKTQDHQRNVAEWSSTVERGPSICWLPSCSRQHRRSAVHSTRSDCATLPFPPALLAAGSQARSISLRLRPATTRSARPIHAHGRAAHLAGSAGGEGRARQQRTQGRTRRFRAAPPV